MSCSVLDCVSDAFRRLLARTPVTQGKHVRVVLRIALIAAVVAVVCSFGLRVYLHSMERRALSLLAEAESIKVGDNEEWVLPLVARYGGHMWRPTAFRKDAPCIVLNRCDNEEKDIYGYEVRLSPFQVFSAAERNASFLDQSLVYTMSRIPHPLRELIGLRNWLVAVGVRIHNGRVMSLSGSTYVEGRTYWLGSVWRRLDSISSDGKPPGSYSVDLGYLHMTTTGHVIEQSLTGSATEEQVKNSYITNERCLTGLIPCASLCDFKPGLFQYLKDHPEIPGNFDTRSYCSQ